MNRETIQALKNNKYYIIGSLILLCVSLILFFSSKQTPKVENKDEQIVIDFYHDNLPIIETGHYSLWGVNNDEETTLLKRFDSYGETLASMDGSFLKQWRVPKPEKEYQKYYVSTEAIGDRDGVLDGCRILENDTTSLENDFKLSPLTLDSISAEFILATHTDTTTNTNEKSGVWFTTKLQGDQTKNSMKLPLLNDCWTWATYLEFRGEYYRIGRFDKPNSEDDFSDFSLAQTNPISIPGEDFLKNIEYAPLLIPQNGNRLILAIEPKSSVLRLMNTYKPYWEILEYTFVGDEPARTPISMTKVQQPSFSIQVTDNPKDQI